MHSILTLIISVMIVLFHNLYKIFRYYFIYVNYYSCTSISWIHTFFLTNFQYSLIWLGEKNWNELDIFILVISCTCVCIYLKVIRNLILCIKMQSWFLFRVEYCNTIIFMSFMVSYFFLSQFYAYSLCQTKICQLFEISISNKGLCATMSGFYLHGKQFLGNNLTLVIIFLKRILWNPYWHFTAHLW